MILVFYHLVFKETVAQAKHRLINSQSGRPHYEPGLTKLSIVAIADRCWPKAAPGVNCTKDRIHGCALSFPPSQADNASDLLSYVFAASNGTTRKDDQSS
jgi:hypothetical protein